MPDATGRAWLRVATRHGCPAGNRCWWCLATLEPDAHLHLYREFETYRDDPHEASFGVCSEGCAIRLVGSHGYTLIAQPEDVRTLDDVA